MALDDYDGLKTAVSDWLDRDDLSAQVDNFIDLAEARHKSEVRIREMVTRASITVNARQVSVPDGFLEVVPGGFRLLTTPVTQLEYVNLTEMNRRRSESTGKPSLFTVHAQFEFDKGPDESYSGEIVYYQSVTALSDENTSNDILTRAPDLYLYGALLATAPFLGNDERIPVWQGLYDRALAHHNLSARKERTGGPAVARVAGPTP